MVSSLALPQLALAATQAQSPQTLAQAFEAIRQKHNLPALAGTIVTAKGAGEILATGVRKAGTDVPVTANDKWHLGSDTKVMTACLLATFVGLWFSAGGMRVVVSGRIDERRRSAGSLKRGLPLLAFGLILLFGGTWLVRWAQM